MESGKRATGVVALVAMMVVLHQLMAAPMAMARSLQDTTSVLSLNRSAREFAWQGGISCGETCLMLPCFIQAIGCRCKNKICYK
ncbi:hypothetical protein SETIT_3G339600v2 [Setaria italica]|uniref:Knottin scorpion toxin-like domain-containing protein n=1 Tax=Setaria italica TaxID=4555 RepID=K3ZBA6_SETIT|nr:hypothetical protein SETIT_3G339600v2 [Setaria italica]